MTWKGHDMPHQLREDSFSQIFASGGVRTVEMKLDSAGRAVVVYTLQTGAQGLVHTKRGELKHYKPETAMRFLRSLGCARICIDLSAWTLSSGGSQGSLL